MKMEEEPPTEKDGGSGSGSGSGSGVGSGCGSRGGDSSGDGNESDAGKTSAVRSMTEDRTIVELARLRLRRCKSTSRAEDIVTETEKRRRAQPDKPVHKPRDSILSMTSGFHNFEGIINWAFLILFMGGVRLCLENLNKYGVRVDPNKWLHALFGKLASNKPREYPTLYLLAYLNVVVIFTFALEKLMTKGFISRTIGYTFHLVDHILLLLIPVIVINAKYEHVGPVKGTLIVACFLITFLKTWSYIQVNYWCHCARRSPAARAKAGHRLRHPSLAEFNTLKPKKISTAAAKVENNTGNNEADNIVQYPDNITLSDIYYFWFAPTLCYELNFPRMDRIRKMFLLRRLLEVIIGTNVTFALIQQWIIPSVVNSLIPFSKMEFGKAVERVLKLAIPNHLIWLTWFYLIFHSFLNTTGEIMQFADRQFYKDWWNANNVKTFWTTWNIPVHRWCVRHLFKPALYAGYNMFSAKIIVFLFSAFFHEYLISVPLGIVKPYAFIGMMSQVPMFYISEVIEKQLGPRFGNMVVWVSLIIGQPLAVMMYYHDFVVVHYGSELIERFGRL